MKTHSNRVVGARLFAWLTCVGLFAGCMHSSSGSERVPLQTSSNVPSATGDVKAKVEKDGNMKISVAVDHMAPPQKVSQGATTYVVWAQPITGGPAQNLGSLKINSSERSAKLDTMTSARDMKILVTPEPSPAVTKPSASPVLWTTVTQ
jgi:hypothetical protein